MHIYSHSLAYIDPLPLIDREFDSVEVVSSLFEHAPAVAVPPGDDRAWEDQLDDGEEMSL